MVNLSVDQNFIRCASVENDCSAIVRWNVDASNGLLYGNEPTGWWFYGNKIDGVWMLVYEGYCKIFRGGILEVCSSVTSRILLINVLI